ncbi:MAG: LamG-like jellyroll fold domain-containing protein [Bacteroidota bacterium]
MLGDSMMLGGGRKAAYSIENSLLFRGAQKLSRTFTTPTAQYIWTFRALVRREALGVAGNGQVLFGATSGSGSSSSIGFTTSDQLFVNSSDVSVVTSTAVSRDPTSWYDVLVSSDGTTVKGCVNGVEVFSYAGAITWINTALVHEVGERNFGGHYYKGYMAEVCFVDGQALPPGRFGETDPVTGSWRPKAITGITWGNNGFYLGKPWKGAGLGTDYSGRGNHWTATGFAANDVRNDSPTNIYATLNPLYFQSAGASGPYSPSQTPVFSDGNGSFSIGASPSSWANPTGVAATHAILPGTRVYFECAVLKPSYFSLTCGIGTSADVTKPTAGTHPNGGGAGWTQTSVGLLRVRDTGDDRGAVYANAVAVPGWGAVGSSISAVQVAVDLVNNRMWIGQGGTWLNGSNPDVLESGIPLTGGVSYFPWFTLSTYSSGENGLTTNFGQKPFLYPVPTGFQPLCSASSPATTGQTSGSFIGNGSTNGPCIYTGAVPLTLSINGNAVVWGTHADKLATGFKIRAASASYNAAGSNTWMATYASPQKPTVGPKGRAPANAQGN